ncbi:MAG: hypothetical protein CMJ17_00370 [Phenylobacterium sp.]|nr:hypothetical protein [Phenylobacterium sp.]
MLTYINTNFQIIVNFQMSLTEIENMIPWERQIYIELLKKHVEEENKKMRERINAQGRSI